MSSDFHFLVPESFHKKWFRSAHKFLRKPCFNFCMHTTLGQGQEMTLTFSTHLPIFYSSLTLCMLGNYMYIVLHSFYAPNFEKVGSILVSACAFVRPFVLPSLQNRIQARILKFHIWIPHQKLAYPYFFLV